MADFTPKKVSKEAAKEKGGMLAHDNTEHQAPPVMHLEAHHIGKLFKGKMPAVGSKIKVSGLAHVGSVSENQDRGDGGKPHRSMTLHLHKMDVGTDGPGKEVDQDAESAKGAKAEMDKALKRGAGGSKKQSTEGEEDGAEATPRAGGD